MRPTKSLLLKCALLGFVALLSDSDAVLAGESISLPGQSIYDQVQRMRADAGRLIEKKATSQTLHKAIGLLDGALAELDRPESEELANGSVYLRFRRLDVELDIAQAFAINQSRDMADCHKCSSSTARSEESQEPRVNDQSPVVFNLLTAAI